MKYIVISFSLLILFSSHCRADIVDEILQGAYAEIKNETKYNTEMLENYFSPSFKEGQDTGKAVYPNGDVNPNEGICADLIVRALRNGGIDLQKSVHRDILSDREAYKVRRPDRFADHRRVWILKTFFQRNWKVLSRKLGNPLDWQPGDVVIWDIGSNRHFHIGIIGKKKRADGLPHVIHNMRHVPFVFTGKTSEQDVLEGPKFLGNSVGEWKIIGHYRYP